MTLHIWLLVEYLLSMQETLGLILKVNQVWWHTLSIIHEARVSEIQGYPWLLRNPGIPEIFVSKTNKQTNAFPDADRTHVQRRPNKACVKVSMCKPGREAPRGMDPNNS